MGQPNQKGAPHGEVWSRPFAAFLFTLVALIVGSAAIRATFRMHADRDLLETGEAEWIWFSRDVPRPAWVRFYMTRDFDLPEAPVSAVAKVFGDRRHVLYINGFGLGGGELAPGDPLWLHDLTPQVRKGKNRIVIVLESNTGIGGLLFALDVAGLGRNVVVSDERWRFDFSESAISRGGRFPAVSWGRPPMYPWRYPRLPRPEERKADVEARAAALSGFQMPDGRPAACTILSIASRAAIPYGLIASYPQNERTFR